MPPTEVLPHTLIQPQTTTSATTTVGTTPVIKPMSTPTSPRIQAHTFIRWMNNKLIKAQKPLVRSLVRDLQSGVPLITLVHVCLGKEALFTYHEECDSEEKRRENWRVFLGYLQENGVIDSDTAESTEDIMAGNVKLILGLVWMLIEKYHIKTTDARQAMLDWMQVVIPAANIRNFTTDWNTGRALSALVNTCVPGSVPGWNILDDSQSVENITNAMQLAEEDLSIPALLAPDDMANPDVDEMSIMTYISCFNATLIKNLVMWLESKLPNRSIDNLKVDWSNGVNLALLIETLAPGSWADVEGVNPDTAEENVSRALSISQKVLGVVPILKMEDIVNMEVSELHMATYLWQFKTGKVTSDHAGHTAQRCQVSGPGITHGTVGERATFTVNTVNAGVGSLNVKISNSFDEDVRAQVEDMGLGEYSVTFLPCSPGDHVISVVWAEQHVPGSPFRASVLGPPDASKCVVSGDGLHIARPGWPAEILINTQTAGGGELNASIQGPQTNQEVEIEQYGEGRYRGKYTAKETGDHSLFVFWSGEPVPGSPFLVHVEDSLPASAMIKTTGGRMLQTERVHLAGESIELDVDTQEAGEGQLAAVAIGPKGDAVPVEIVANRNKTFTLKLLTSRGGRYLVNVYFNGSHIPNSPFKVRVCNPEAIWAEGPGLMDSYVGDQGDFQVFTKDAGHGTLSVRVNGPKDKFRVDMWKGAERTVNCRYNPEVPGKYTINIKWEEQHIKGSPYTIIVKKRRENGNGR